MARSYPEAMVHTISIYTAAQSSIGAAICSDTGPHADTGSVNLTVGITLMMSRLRVAPEHRQRISISAPSPLSWLRPFVNHILGLNLGSFFEPALLSKSLAAATDGSIEAPPFAGTDCASDVIGSGSENNGVARTEERFLREARDRGGGLVGPSDVTLPPADIAGAF